MQICLSKQQCSPMCTDDQSILTILVVCRFQFPELDPLIMRRFSEEGDVERAVELVKQVSFAV